MKTTKSSSHISQEKKSSSAHVQTVFRSMSDQIIFLRFPSAHFLSPLASGGLGKEALICVSVKGSVVAAPAGLSRVRGGGATVGPGGVVAGEAREGRQDRGGGGDLGKRWKIY